MRKFILMEHYAETETAITKGQCTNIKGFYHIDTPAQTTCSAHASLSALKS
jgi:hypothetical protein